jgi:hypothetical protein
MNLQYRQGCSRASARFRGDKASIPACQKPHFIGQCPLLRVTAAGFTFAAPTHADNDAQHDCTANGTVTLNVSR